MKMVQLPSPGVRRLATAVAWAAAVALCAGCAGRPAPAPGPLPPAAPPGYDAPPAPLQGVDTSPLAGRRIVLDPGHGGVFRGALGPGGLTEAEVNLGVAHHLRGLLEWAGAEVTMTRTVDRDLLTSADSSLEADLAARVALAAELLPDVFVSIHHNSNPAYDPALNSTETYYPIGREDASLDLARAVHRHLVRALGIRPARLRPGNFHVLRRSPVPAVLGEPSMISNPEVEKRLGLAAKQALEAQAYFLGLLEYFAGGTPAWVAAPAAASAEEAAAPAALRWRFDPGARDAPLLDPSTVELTVDGLPVPVALAPGGDEVTWAGPAGPACGELRLELAGRNLAGRAAPTWRGAWDAGPPDEYVGSRWAEQGPGARTLLSWRPARPCGSEPADARPVELVLLGGSVPAPLTGFRGSSLLPTSAVPAEPRLRLGSSGEEATLRLVRGRLPAGWRWVALPVDLAFARGGFGPWRARLLPHLDELPAGAEVHAAVDPSRFFVPLAPGRGWWLEADGALPLVSPPGEARDLPEHLPWRALLPGVAGKVIVIDPGADDEEAPRTGEPADGAAEAALAADEFLDRDLSLRVAEIAAALLRGAGATVHLTRRDDRWIAPEAKVALANETRADLFLVVGRATAPGQVRLRHHAGSRAGAEWARLVGLALSPPLAATPPAGEDSYLYLLRQTACPALRVDLGPPGTPAEEDAALSPGRLHAEARALLLGTAAFLSGPETLLETLDPAALATVRARPDLDWARLDGNFLWLPAAGAAAPPLPALGPDHFLELRAGGRWELWSLRREGEAWREDLLLEGDTGAPEPAGAPRP